MPFRRPLAHTLARPLGLASSAQARQSDLLDRAVARWAKVKTARATFEQTIVNSLTGNTLTATGEYQQQRPGKLSVRFDNPATDRIVADGKQVWLYLPSTAPGQVIRSSLADGGTGTVDLSAQFLTAPRSRYTVSAAGTATVSGRATHAFTLVPKSAKSAQFKTATVYIDDVDATIRQFEVTEPSGLQRKVRLTSFRTNVPVDAAAFRFTPPAGVRIVER
ncbi:MAG: outer membrane lipoprotein chaperone LolA [Gemmatimonadaceae bacterium]|nr:outer membrane lipoprotein chaperone LolA [Gemmatimonadaceae bacterium]